MAQKVKRACRYGWKPCLSVDSPHAGQNAINPFELRHKSRPRKVATVEGVHAKLQFGKRQVSAYMWTMQTSSAMFLASAFESKLNHVVVVPLLTSGQRKNRVSSSHAPYDVADRLWVVS